MYSRVRSYQLVPSSMQLQQDIRLRSIRINLSYSVHRILPAAFLLDDVGIGGGGGGGGGGRLPFAKRVISIMYFLPSFSPTFLSAR